MPAPKVLIAIIVVTVLGIGLIGGGLYFFMSESDSDGSANRKYTDVGSCAQEGKVCEKQGLNTLYLTSCKGTYPDCDCSYINCGTKGCTNRAGCKTESGGWIDNYDAYVNNSDEYIEATGCTDSDGGLLFSTKGICSAATAISDGCVSTSFLREAYCGIDKSCMTELHDCTAESKICIEGACQVARQCSTYNLYTKYKSYSDFSDTLLGQPVGTTITAAKNYCKSLSPDANWYAWSNKFGCSAGIGSPSLDCNSPATLIAKSVCSAINGDWTCNENMRIATCSCESGEQTEEPIEEEGPVCQGTVSGNEGEGFIYDCAGPCDDAGNFCTPNTDTLKCECMSIEDSCRNFCTANGMSAGHPIPCAEYETPLNTPQQCCCLVI